MKEFQSRPRPVSQIAGSRGRGAATQDGRLAGLQRRLNAGAPARHLQFLQRVANGRDAPVQRVNDEEELLQGKALQRMDDEEDLLQGKAVQLRAAPYLRPTCAPLQRKGGGDGLPDDLRAGIENLSGLSMDGVRVHRNSAAPARVGAHAYAQGTDIHLAPGQDRHLPHEASHVVQQAQGRVRPTMNVSGTAVNDDPGLEAEADRMGGKAMQMAPQKKSGLIPDRPARAAATGRHAVQRREVQLEIDGKNYAAYYDGDTPGWVKFPRGGNTCWLNLQKSAAVFDAARQKFVVPAETVPYVKNWMGGKLILYRGVNVGHAVYEEAQRGEAPEKPDAKEAVPDFTSDSSTTRFIPFSTDREIGMMGVKSSSEEGGDRMGYVPQDEDEQIGVLLRLMVGTGSTIGIFDPGEIQVLSPPLARVIPITGKSLHYNRRLDSQPLGAEAIIAHLDEQLNDPMWSSLGVGLLTNKVPSGVAEMRHRLAAGNWKGVLRYAVVKHNSEDPRRNPRTSELYRMLDQLALRARDAELM